MLNQVMIYPDEQLARQLTPYIKRVLVLDGGQASARLLNELLRDLGALHVNVRPTNAQAMSALERFDPQVIFTELSGADLDGVAFICALRRTDLPCRQAPVIVVTAAATAAAILASRQAGAHEFLRKPYTVKDLIRRLDAAILRPRDWIEAISYIGPDRRRFNSGDHAGPLKRLTDHPPTPDMERVRQALKILRSAIEAIETNPLQALRSMRAQAAELQAVALAASDITLMGATAKLQRQLTAAAATGRLSRADIEAGAVSLWQLLPNESETGAETPYREVG
jgi:CheY-like chemotaxis protein